MNEKFCSKRYIPKYCNQKLKWFEKDFDHLDLYKWEQFEKNENSYIKNCQITSFSEIYCNIGFKPMNNSLKKLRKLTPQEVTEDLIKIYQTVTSSMVNNIPCPQTTRAIAASLRSNEKDLFVEKDIVIDHFSFLQKIMTEKTFLMKKFIISCF